MHFDMEQLKLILETAKTAGSGAYWIAVMYIAKDLAGSFLGFTAGMLTLLAAYKLILKGIRSGMWWERLRGNMPKSVGREFMDSENLYRYILKLQKEKDNG